VKWLAADRIDGEASWKPFAPTQGTIGIDDDIHQKVNSWLQAKWTSLWLQNVTCQCLSHIELT
jgi:hypothetical protein